MTRALALACFASLLFVSTASAQEDDADARALELYETGVAAYEEGRYEDAVEAFREAHELSPRPLLLYNLANAEERLGHHREAADALAEYLPDADIDERAQIETRIRNLRLRVAEEEAAEGEGEGEGEGETDSGPPPDFSGLMLPGFVLAGGGAVLIITGAIFGGLALGARGQVTGGDDPLCSETADGRLLCSGDGGGLISDDEAFALIADIGLFGGGAVAAAGVALIVLAATSPGPGGPESALLPELRVGPNGAYAGLRGSFR